MSKYLDLSIKEIHDLLVKKEIKVSDLVKESFERIEENNDLNAFITLDKEEAMKRALELDKEEVESDNLLFGIPIAIKDNINTKGLRTTCASKILDNFIPPFDATIIEKIKNKKMIIVGKCNMDEFAMGSTSQTSYYGAPRNPWDKTRIAGGSSGGSAAAVSSRMVPLALGSDTGGSIRQPASYTGLVGMKPTYGRVSRFGVIAFASSLDQVGPMTRNVYENALLLDVISGQDENDLTSCYKEKEDFTRLIGEDIKGMKIAVPNYLVSDVVDKKVLEVFNGIISLLKENGAIVDYIDIKYLDMAVPLYQVIAMGEASSNLAKFDGIRFGYSVDNPTSLEDLYLRSRAEGFGDEVRRRIMVGSYILSGDNAKVYRDKAMIVRNEMKKGFDKAFEEYDLIIGPTTTTTAYHLGEFGDDPLKVFLDDVLVIPVNMVGLPGMNLPMGFVDEMPIGMHIVGRMWDEAVIYKLGSFIEAKLNLDLTPGGMKNDN